MGTEPPFQKSSKPVVPTAGTGFFCTCGHPFRAPHESVARASFQNSLRVVGGFHPGSEFPSCMDYQQRNYKATSSFSWDQFLCITFAQLTYGESLPSSQVPRHARRYPTPRLTSEWLYTGCPLASPTPHRAEPSPLRRGHEVGTPALHDRSGAKRNERAFNLSDTHSRV